MHTTSGCFLPMCLYSSTKSIWTHGHHHSHMRLEAHNGVRFSETREYTEIYRIYTENKSSPAHHIGFHPHQPTTGGIWHLRRLDHFKNTLICSDQSHDTLIYTLFWFHSSFQSLLSQMFSLCCCYYRLLIYGAVSMVHYRRKAWGNSRKMLTKATPTWAWKENCVHTTPDQNPP